MTQSLEQSNLLSKANLVVFDSSDQTTSMAMRDGTSLIVGADESCGLKLSGKGVSPKHCVLRLDHGILHVNDWYSETGTLVNNQPISCETVLERTDELRVGEYRIKVVLESTDGPTPPTSQPPVQEIEESPPADESSHNDRLEEPAADDQLQRQLDQAKAQIQQLEEELELQLSLGSSQEQNAASEEDSYQFDALQSDEVEMLRVEVSQLQSELADRDQELAELTASALDGPAETCSEESSETTRLVERLEQLLDEQQMADQRLLGLEDLLRASEEASQAEREERMQLESWVEDIEQRVIGKENEWRAQEERLESNIVEITRQRDLARAKLAQALREGGDSANKQAVADLEEMQLRNNELEEKLAHANEEVARLQERVDANQETAGTEELKRQVREQEARIAEQRAEIARQRAEFLEAHEEAESSKGDQPSIDNPDVRLRAFRQHLREIHEEEQEEKRQRSLSARLSRIWQRLESR